MGNLSAEKDAIEKRAVRKATLRLAPLLTLGYLINYIDRTNVGFAALTMNDAIGISASQFGFAAGILYIGYSIFEVPSNLALYRFGASLWLGRIMITWGLAAGATAFVVDAPTLYIVRFITGAAEAGFFPGAIFYITTWFPPAYRGRMLGWLMLGSPLSSIISGPASVSLLKLDGLWGHAGWQWMFVVEGIPAVILGVFFIFVIPDTPRNARWLTAQEREALEAKPAFHEPGVNHNLWSMFRDPRVLILALAYFCYTSGVIGIGIWLPQLLSGYGLSMWEVGVMSAVPYFVACITTLLWARAVDRYKNYVLHSVVAGCLAAIGFLLSFATASPAPTLVAITLAVVGMNAFKAPFFNLPPQFLGGAAAAGGIALINSLGSLGGFLGPYLLGSLREATGSFSLGLLSLSSLLGISVVLVLLFGVKARGK
jgi:ACS family tartrate transporter-like MFS transporter